ncbi:MAG: hypothetical protein ACK5MA_06965 [Parachlamydiaceae bacterium]
MTQHIARNAVGAVTPNFTVGHLLLFKGATLLKKIAAVVRKIRLYRNLNNQLPLAIGSILNVTVGNNPTVQQIARFLFGTISAIKCSEDLILLTGILRELKENFKGDSYLMVKGGKGFESGRFKARLHWAKDVWLERIKRTFQLIGAFFKQLGSLSLHILDVEAAFNENTVSEMIVHGSDLWRHLSSDEEVLAKTLLRKKDENDLLFARFQSTFRTQALLQILTVPVRVRNKMPDSRDVRRFFREQKAFFKVPFQILKEKVKGLPDEERTVAYCTEGVDDPASYKVLPSPKLPLEVISRDLVKSK